MRVLLIDHWGGDGMLDIAMRMMGDGHDIRWHYRPNGKNDNMGKGIVPRVFDWRDHMRWADLIVLADNTKYLMELDNYRKRGFPIIGATVESAAWELNRTLGQQVFKSAGIDVPPYKEFQRYDDAIAYVTRENRRFVSKPLGDEPDKSLSYVSKSAADLIYMLGKWKRKAKLKEGFILQEFVGGCEMAVGAFVGPHGFNEGFCENWEFKSLMAGDKGPNVGEMGTVLRFVRSSKLADKVLKPLEDLIVSTGHTGYVDVNCIIDEDGNPWPLEWTMRFGWPTFNIQQALIKGDHAQWLADLSTGRDSKPFELQLPAVGVVMALPEFPYGRTLPENVTGVPVYGLTPALSQHVHPCAMMQGSAPLEINGKVVDSQMLVTSGDYVLVASGTGPSVRSAARGAYRVLDRLSAPASPFWRPDIGKRLATQLPEIQAKGYARALTY